MTNHEKLTVTKKRPKDTIQFMEISIHCSNGLPRTTLYNISSTICNYTISLLFLERYKSDIVVLYVVRYINAFLLKRVTQLCQDILLCAYISINTYLLVIYNSIKAPILVICDHTNVFLLLFLIFSQHDCKCAYQTIIIIIIPYFSTNSKQSKYRDG